MDESLNVFGEPLEPCSFDPVTGFFRNGCCDTSDEDLGSHTVCTLMTVDFLNFSVSAGNDLVTPRPQWGFEGLKPGDTWCLCASRWLEAYRAGVPPLVNLRATHKRALEIVPLELLERFSSESED
ncbi:MAG: DUF2237 domain-containing protein [Leptospiraceae bacterium]|jgi:uncharacterized protein (DUF2237 family)|nr:DUF2237 domain-containing protein [Leptospiraceae bacterium]MCZ8347564.1 DUF2237 domain-containing protein [Leptospiraceae bacterium]PJE03875.1 MAG: hypothetical protein CK427_03290 [Leptospira sp.]